MRILLAAAAALLAASPPVHAQPTGRFTVDALLATEGLGKTRMSEDGRWLVVERQVPWNRAATYRYGNLTSHLLTRLEIFQTGQPIPALELHSPDGAAGYLSGPFSPDGRRMVVYRLTEDAWRLGVLSLDTLTLHWFDVTPEYPRYGQTVAWRSSEDLVLIAREADDLPLFLRMPYGAQSAIAALWSAQERGHTPSSVYIPSGSSRDARDRGRPSRLLQLNVRTGEDRTLARGDFIDLELSPTGRSVAALRDDGDYQIGANTAASTGEWLRRRRLVVADLDTGQAREPLPDQDFITHLMTWSETGDRLITFARDEGEGFAQGRFWIVPARGPAEVLDLGVHRPWVDAAWDGIPLVFAGWDGSVPVAQVRSMQGDRLWRRAGQVAPVSGPGERLVRADGRLFILTADGLHQFGQSERLLEGRFGLAERPFDGGDRRNHNPDPVWLGRQTWTNAAGCLAMASILRPSCPSEALQGETIVAASIHDGSILTRGRGPDGVTRLTLRTSGARFDLGVLNGEHATIGWGDVVPVDHTGPGGAPLRSWLLLPPGRNPETPAPVAVLAYPGDSNASSPRALQPGFDRLHLNPHLLADAGYAVLIPSLPVEDRLTALDNIAERILAVVDAAARQGLVDPDRTALIGHSFGAHAALLAATRTDRFRAIIASNGFADLSTSTELKPYWRAVTRDGVPATTMAGWAETGQGGVGRPFVLAPEAYVSRSPLYSARRIVTPTLLIESDLDGARLSALFAALYRQDREAALLTVYGEGHEFAAPANVRILHERVIAWLDRYLMPASKSRRPAPQPGLEDGQDERSVGRRSADQGGLGQGLIEGRHIDQTMAG